MTHEDRRLLSGEDERPPPEARNERHSGARKFTQRTMPHPDPLDTGDPADRPQKPFGLSEPLDERRSSTRHDDGEEPPRD